MGAAVQLLGCVAVQLAFKEDTAREVTYTAKQPYLNKESIEA
jgi:hypothetical protein